jgi:large conductance mechanosensitive channel
MIKEFKQFLLRGNVVDLAVGVMIGAAFSAVVSTLVADLLTPFAAAIAQVPDFSGLSFTLNGSVITYGKVLNALISFVLVATAIFFFIVKPMNLLIARTRREDPIDPTTKKCPECMTEVPLAARRCAACAQVIA